jgi:ferritin
MINPKVETALNKQINAEWYSAYLYQGMGAVFEAQGLKGMAHWMNIQVLEEMTHGMKIYNYILEKGGTVNLMAIDAPPGKWETPLTAFEAAYKHELKVTGLINDLVNMSIAEKDHATTNMLQWYVNEQVEEEASVQQVAQQLKLAQGAAGALFMIDKDLMTRVFTGGALGPNPLGGGAAQP